MLKWWSVVVYGMMIFSEALALSAYKLARVSISSTIADIKAINAEYRQEKDHADQA